MQTQVGTFYKIIICFSVTEAISNIRVSGITTKSITLAFEPVSQRGNIQGYKVYYEPVSGIFKKGGVKMMTIGKDTTEAIISDLDENVMYRMWMTAFNSAGEGPASSQLRVRTGAGTWC